MQGRTLRKKKLIFTDALPDVVQQFKNRYPEKKLTAAIEPDADLVGHPILLKLLVSNLLENANKYSEKCAPITCKLQRIMNKIPGDR